MFKPKLQWIDETDPESIKQSRVHRQKEFHRAKRWKQVRQWQQSKEANLDPTAASGDQSSSSTASQESTPASSVNSRPDSSSPKGTSHSPEEDEDPFSAETSQSQTPPARKQQRAQPGVHIQERSLSRIGSVTDRARSASPSKWQHESQHLLDILSSSRRDPFGMLPAGSDERGNLLVSHYLFDIPRMVYNVKDSKPNKEVLFPLALTGPAAFQATLLVSAACHIAQLQGLSDSVDSIEQKSKAIRLIQECLDSPDPSIRTSDNVITAVLSMADAENLFGYKDKAALHMQGLTAIIKERRGRLDRKLGIHMNWVNYCLQRPTNLAELSYWSVYTIKETHPPSRNIGFIDLDDFTDFLSNARLLAEDPLTKRHQLWRRYLFQPDSIIYKICELPMNYDAWEIDLVPVYTRIAALMHINAALWEYKDSPAALDSYLATLDKILIEGDFSTSLSTGFFIYNMMKLDYDELERNYGTSASSENDSEQRTWFVARILRVCKLLGKDSMISVHNALLGFLDPSSTISSNDCHLRKDWIDHLRLEIIRSDSQSATVSIASSAMTSPTAG